MALAPRFRMGPPPRSFAADADDCIMVGIPSGPPNTSLWRDVRARWRAPLGPSRREDRASGHEIEEEARHHAPGLTRKAPYKCNRCKKQVRLTAGTVFQDTKLPLTAWFAAVYHLTQAKEGISSIELGRRLGVRRQTAWLVKRKLMRAMAAREAEKPKPEGRVEVDDAYLGGERPGGKRGRGAAGKTPIVAAVETTAERKPKRLRFSVVKGFRKKEVERLAKRDFAKIGRAPCRQRVSIS